MYCKELMTQLAVKIYQERPNPVYTAEEIAQFVEENTDKLHDIFTNYLDHIRQKHARRRKIQKKRR